MVCPLGVHSHLQGPLPCRRPCSTPHGFVCSTLLPITQLPKIPFGEDGCCQKACSMICWNCDLPQTSDLPELQESCSPPKCKTSPRTPGVHCNTLRALAWFGNHKGRPLPSLGHRIAWDVPCATDSPLPKLFTLCYWFLWVLKCFMKTLENNYFNNGRFLEKIYL